MSRHAWANEGPETVVAGVHRIPLPLPNDALAAVNVYLLETETGLTVVDGGWSIPEARRVFEDSLRSLGHRLEDISDFLVTHGHRDHYTQAAALRDELGCRLRLGAGERDYLEVMRSDPVGGAAYPAQMERAGAPHLMEAWWPWLKEQPRGTEVWSAPDAWLTDGQVVDLGGRTLQVVETPGHTRGHVVFADHSAGVLFAGDHVLPTITPSIGFEPSPRPRALARYLASLVKVRALGDLTLLAAHGPAAPSSHERIEQLLAHHDGRFVEFVLAVGQGAETAFEAASLVTWTRRKLRLEQMEPYNQCLAVLETMLHLDLLEERGELCGFGDEVRRWVLARTCGQVPAAGPTSL